jgi:hypothetical protein
VHVQDPSPEIHPLAAADLLDVERRPARHEQIDLQIASVVHEAGRRAMTNRAAKRVCIDVEL